MVRFLRNALVAKVAGQQFATSADFRRRASTRGRVAARFSEEDLARFLQIMLRTHAELGYKQEQRFHLELGLLKLVHAQRLLPLEELLSGASTSAKTGGTATPARAAGTTSHAASGIGSRKCCFAKRDTDAVARSPGIFRPNKFKAGAWWGPCVAVHRAIAV